ncbi:hypothetical protein [Deinococcus alpinitundrae]|uniref:hypothetical protein n=1 Tax=Deinococcus alpinitundrae TaxID=468913 RepID=UPI00137B5FB7|nr:hypothetical protein [Deinococcus alpinitundrae]
MKRFPILLLGPALLLSGCGGVAVPGLSDALTKAELRLSAQLLMPLLSATTVQLAAREFGQPLLPTSPALGGQKLTPAALSCGQASLGSDFADADHDRIPAQITAQLDCGYTDEDPDTTSALKLSGSMTVADTDDHDPASGLMSTAQLSGTAQTQYKTFSGSLDTTSRARAVLQPTSGDGGSSGSLTFGTSSVGSGQAFGLASRVTISRTLDAQLDVQPDADQRGGNLTLVGRLSSRNDLSRRSSDLQLSGTLHAAQEGCRAADSGSVVFSKGSVSLTATVTDCGVYSYE